MYNNEDSVLRSLSGHLTALRRFWISSAFLSVPTTRTWKFSSFVLEIDWSQFKIP